MKLSTLLVSLSALFSAGCSSISMDHNFDPQIDTAGYENFDLLPIPHQDYDEGARQIIGGEDFSLVIVQSILEAKGYVRQRDAEADFYVGVRAAVEEPATVGGGHASWRASPLASSWQEGRLASSIGDPFPGYEQPASIDKDRRFDTVNGNLPRVYYLIVEVFDTATRKVVWNGYARSDSPMAFAKDAKRARMIESILEPFPN